MVTNDKQDKIVLNDKQDKMVLNDKQDKMILNDKPDKMVLNDKQPKMGLHDKQDKILLKEFLKEMVSVELLSSKIILTMSSLILLIYTGMIILLYTETLMLSHDALQTKPMDLLDVTERPAAMYNDYLKRFGKEYDNEEVLKRFEIFKDSLKEIARLNHESGAKFGLTKFSDMSNEEMFPKSPSIYQTPGCSHIQKPCNRKMNKDDFPFYYTCTRIPYIGQSPPKKHDWRERGVVGPVLDQKLCNGCWAFGIVGVMESMVAIGPPERDIVRLSIQEVIECSTCSQCKSGNVQTALSDFCDGGWSVVTEEQYPLLLANGSCDQKQKRRRGRHIKQFCQRCDVNEYKVILPIVSFHGPVIAIVNAAPWRNYLEGIIQWACFRGYNTFDHVVQIVGYDISGEIPYYIIRNSWGEDFGENGYVKVKIGGNVCGIGQKANMVTLTVEEFGQHKGETVKKFIWQTRGGFTLSAISYGAIVQSIKVPDKNGVTADVVLGFDDLASYVERNVAYFGAAVGRCANRIGGATFELDGIKFELAKNVGDDHLHGGIVGFDKVNWHSTIDGTRVTFSYLSKDREENYPGHLVTSVSYDVTDECTLLMEFTATTTKRTVVNLTNHSYFNLAGHDAGAEELYQHAVAINADKITETTSSSIPTGRFIRVGDSPFDFRTATNLGQAMIKGKDLFDDNFCVSTYGNKGLNFVSRVIHPASGRFLEVYSDQPGVQFYTGNFLPSPSDDALIGKDGVGYRKHGAFCLETQNFPDAIHHANFPTAVLNPGEVYKHRVQYRFGADNSVEPRVIKG